MQPTSLDTLERCQLPPNQARAILQAMELEITAHEVGLCTRDELRDAVHSLELKIEAAHNDLELKIESLCADLDLKLEMLRNEMRGLEARMMRFTVSCMLAQTGIMAGALYFALGHFRP